MVTNLVRGVAIDAYLGEWYATGSAEIRAVPNPTQSPVLARMSHPPG
jgi:hypothetical protein